MIGSKNTWQDRVNLLLTDKLNRQNTQKAPIMSDTAHAKPETTPATIPALDYNEIKRIIPHRYPFLLIDAVRDIIPYDSAVGIKNVTLNEPHFEGHFPQRPVMPGVMIVESMAQTAAILSAKSMDISDNNFLFFLMTIDKCKFRKTVQPPDQLELHVQFLRHKQRMYRFAGQARVDGKLVAEAEFQAMQIPE